jgi:type IV secretion system protein VirD4
MLLLQRKADFSILRKYPGPVVVHDPTSRKYWATERFRRDRLGHTIVRLDPLLFGGPEGAGSFNPLLFIDPQALDFFDQCRDLADLLVGFKRMDSTPFWDESARLFLIGLIALVCASEPDVAQRHLQLVRDVVSLDKGVENAITVMQKIDNPLVRRLGSSMAFFGERERNNVIATLGRHIDWMQSDAVAASLTSNSFDVSAIRTGKISVYMVVPFRRQTAWAPLLRLWKGCFLSMLSDKGVREFQD